MGQLGSQATVSELSLICDINRDSLMELMLQHTDSHIGWQHNWPIFVRAFYLDIGKSFFKEALFYEQILA